jgi:putative MATE family efflux protein
MDKVSEMGEAPLGRLLLSFSLPSIAIMLVNALYNLVDRIFIGQGIGTAGLAAVTAGFPMMLIAEGLGALLSSGSSTLISVAMGKGERDEASSVLSQSFFAAICVSLPLMAASWIFMDPVLRLFGTTEAIMPLARSYIGAVTAGFVFQIVQMAVANSLRAQNKPKAAMIATVSGAALNTVLDPLFIFIFHWSLAGAAWATVASQALSCALTLFFIQDKASVLRIETRKLAFKAETMGPLVKIGLPLFLVHFLALAMLMVANNAMAAYGGATALAAIGIINTLSNLLSFPVMGITQGAGALWGYNYGAGKADRVRRLTAIVALSTSVIAILATALVELFPKAVICLFNGADPTLIELGSHGVSIFMLTFFTIGLQFTSATFFLSIGQAAKGGIVYILRQCLMILGMLVLPRFMGIEGVYWAGPLTDLVCSGIAAILLIGGVKNFSAKPGEAKEALAAA